MDQKALTDLISSQTAIGQAQVVLAVFALLAALWVAWRQFKLMAAADLTVARQIDLAQEQTKILGRIQEISGQQKAIASTQHEILERQAGVLEEHKAIFLRLEQSERNQEGFLRVQAEIQEAQKLLNEALDARKEHVEVRLLHEPAGTGTRLYRIVAKNSGEKSISGFHWEVLITGFHPAIRLREDYMGKPCAPLENERRWDAPDKPFARFSGNFLKPMFRRQEETFATLILDQTTLAPGAPGDFTFECEALTDGGEFTTGEVLIDVRGEGTPF
jgi:hypothetical protein